MYLYYKDCEKLFFINRSIKIKINHELEHFIDDYDYNRNSHFITIELMTDKDLIYVKRKIESFILFFLHFFF